MRNHEYRRESYVTWIRTSPLNDANFVANADKFGIIKIVVFYQLQALWKLG